MDGLFGKEQGVLLRVRILFSYGRRICVYFLVQILTQLTVKARCQQEVGVKSQREPSLHHCPNPNTLMPHNRW